MGAGGQVGKDRGRQGDGSVSPASQRGRTVRCIVDSVESDEAEMSGTFWDLPSFLVKFGLVPVVSYVMPVVSYVTSLERLAGCEALYLVAAPRSVQPYVPRDFLVQYRCCGYRG